VLSLRRAFLLTLPPSLPLSLRCCPRSLPPSPDHLPLHAAGRLALFLALVLVGRLILLPSIPPSGVALVPSLPLLTIFLCTLLGDLPYSLLWSFVGSRGTSLTEMLGGEMEKTPGETALSLLGREGGREGWVGGLLHSLLWSFVGSRGRA